MVIDPALAVVLESLQSRALEGEPRDHLVATAEWAIGVDPTMAERLIPRAPRPALTTATDADRVDCEKPIRDENGKFLGCEAGGGSGSGSSGSSSGSGSGGSSRMSEPEKAAAIERERNHEWRSPEQKALRIKDIEEGRDPEQASQERARAEELRIKEEDDRRRAEADVVIAKAEERGHLLAVPSEKRRTHEELAAKIRGDIDGAKGSLDENAREAVEAIRGIQSFDEDAVDVGDVIGELTSASSALGSLTGSGGVDFDDIDSSDDGGDLDEPEEPGDYAFDPDDVDDGETPEDAEDRQSREHAKESKEYAAARTAYEKRVSEAVAPRAAKARDALIALHAKQTALLESAVAAKKLEDKASRESSKEIEDAGDEDDGNLVDPSKFSGYDDDGNWAGTAEERQQYDEAWDAADKLRSREEQDREAISLDLDTPIAELKQSAKTTAAVVKRLNQYLVRGKHEKAASQPKIPTKAKKAKGEPEPDDDEE